MYSNNLLNISDYANLRPPLELIKNSRLYDLNQTYILNDKTKNAKIVFMNENLWTQEDRDYIKKMKNLLTNLEKSRPSWIKDGDLLRIGQLLGNTLSDKQFLKSYEQYLEFGYKMNFQLTNKEFGL